MIPNKQRTILVVDDEESIRTLLQKVLAGQERTIVLAEEGRKAIEMFRRERPDVTILDLRMPDVNGLDVLKEIRAMDPSATVIVYSGMARGTVEQQARALWASDFVAKRGARSVPSGRPSTRWPKRTIWLQGVTLGRQGRSRHNSAWQACGYPEDDWFDCRFEHDPRFLRRVEVARESLRAGRDMKIEELND